MVWIVTLLVGFLCGSLAYRTGLRGRLRLQLALQDASGGRAALQRAVRLAGRDLRHAALRLSGEAGALAAGARADAAARLAAAAIRCRLLADDMVGLATSAEAISLDEQPVDLAACAREAARSIAAALAPGLRRFELPGNACVVSADRRAVRHVIGRVLTEAALNSGEDDCITVAVEPVEAGIALVIADEGCGTLAADAESGADAPDAERFSRGLGAGLALSRALMEAHGGRLDVIAAPGTGTRASLVFPAYRYPA